MPDLVDGGTLAWVVGALLAIAIAVGVIVFALWYTGDQQEI